MHTKVIVRDKIKQANILILIQVFNTFLFPIQNCIIKRDSKDISCWNYKKRTKNKKGKRKKKIHNIK